MQLAFEQCLELLCCPRCKGDLQRPGDATLHCASCEYSFPIIDGIPVLLPANVAAEQHGLFERYWDSEEKAALYNQKVEGEGEKDPFGVYNHEAEIFGLVALYRNENIDVVLDAGCGNGRFLETFPESSLRIGIDASLNLLRWATQRNRGDFLVCCELEHLPFRDGAFGTVISCRVSQHLKQQKEAVLEMSRVVRDRGDVILELYNTWFGVSVWSRTSGCSCRNPIPNRRRATWIETAGEMVHQKPCGSATCGPARTRSWGSRAA